MKEIYDFLIQVNEEHKILKAVDNAYNKAGNAIARPFIALKGESTAGVNQTKYKAYLAKKAADQLKNKPKTMEQTKRKNYNVADISDPSYAR